MRKYRNLAKETRIRLGPRCSKSGYLFIPSWISGPGDEGNLDEEVCQRLTPFQNPDRSRRKEEVGCGWGWGEGNKAGN